jgi:hypothetical protein
LGAATTSIGYLGPVSFNGGQAIQIHFAVNNSSSAPVSLSTLGTFDLYLDPTSSLVIGLTETGHSDSSFSITYIHEIDFSNYQSTGNGDIANWSGALLDRIGGPVFKVFRGDNECAAFFNSSIFVQMNQSIASMLPTSAADFFRSDLLEPGSTFCQRPWRPMWEPRQGREQAQDLSSS